MYYTVLFPDGCITRTCWRECLGNRWIIDVCVCMCDWSMVTFLSHLFSKHCLPNTTSAHIFSQLSRKCNLWTNMSVCWSVGWSVRKLHFTASNGHLSTYLDVEFLYSWSLPSLMTIPYSFIFSTHWHLQYLGIASGGPLSIKISTKQNHQIIVHSFKIYHQQPEVCSTWNKKLQLMY